MNKSEKLLSAFSEEYFYKEFVIDNLCFVPNGATEIELADLLINLDDIIVAIQLKTRDDDSKSLDVQKEIKWLDKKCRSAKGQIKDTLKFISSGELPSFENKRGQNVKLRADAQIIPLVVFENDQIEEYPHLLRRHSDTGLNINCMSFVDFQEMCKVLITPIEIVSYLEYRKELFENHGDVDVMIFDGIDDELVMTKPTQQESLVYQFLAEAYGIQNSVKQESYIPFFKSFMHLLPDRVIKSSIDTGSYDLLLFLAHMNRNEIVSFWTRLEETKKEAKRGVRGILKSMRRVDGEYAILFVAGGIIDLDTIYSLVQESADVKKVLEVAIYWEDKEYFNVDFLLSDKTKDK